MPENLSIGSTLFLDASQASNDEHGIMSLLSAVEALLTEVGKPLNCGEITNLIIKRRLWVSQGKTPGATINAQLAVDIKKHGCNSRFQRTAPSVFALRSWGLAEYEKLAKELQVMEEKAETSITSVIKPVVSLNLSQQIQQHNKNVVESCTNTY